MVGKKESDVSVSLRYSDQAAHERIADAVLAVFDVAREALLEGRVAFHRDRQIVPARRSLQRPGPGFHLARLKDEIGRLRPVDVGDADAGDARIAIGDLERDRVALLVVSGAYVQVGAPAAGDRSFEAAEEAVRSVDRQVVLRRTGGGNVPGVGDVLVRLDR